LGSGCVNRSQSERDRMKDALEQLKTERLCRGWTLQDVSNRTGISITVLRALESGNSEKLVAPSALDGLLRKYSTALEAQAEKIEDSAQKTSATDGARSRKTFLYLLAGLLLSAVFAAVLLGTVFREILETKRASVKPHEPAVSQTEKSSSISSEGKSSDASVKPHEPAVSQTETSASISSEQKSASGHEELPPRHRELPEVEKQASESSAPDVTVNSAPRPAQDAIPPAEPDDEKPVASIQPPTGVRPAHSLEIVTDQRTWIQVVVDEKKAETELLEAGQTRKWQALNKVDLVVGNGGGVRLRWDGSPVEISSRRGRVVRLTLPKP
jgi:cytoskeleton protein RodZ